MKAKIAPASLERQMPGVMARLKGAYRAKKTSVPGTEPDFDLDWCVRIESGAGNSRLAMKTREDCAWAFEKVVSWAVVAKYGRVRVMEAGGQGHLADVALPEEIVSEHWDLVQREQADRAAFDALTPAERQASLNRAMNAALRGGAVLIEVPAGASLPPGFPRPR
jgi:hypothetical protein